MLIREQLDLQSDNPEAALHSVSPNTGGEGREGAPFPQPEEQLRNQDTNY